MTNFEYITSDKTILALVLNKQHDTDYKTGLCGNCVAYDYCVERAKKTKAPISDCTQMIFEWLNEGIEL